MPTSVRPSPSPNTHDAADGSGAAKSTGAVHHHFHRHHRPHRRTRTMSTNTYPTIETIRIGQSGHECRYCGHSVAKDGPGYRHTTTGQYRCDPASRALNEARLSNSMVRS